MGILDTSLFAVDNLPKTFVIKEPEGYNFCIYAFILSIELFITVSWVTNVLTPAKKLDWS